MSTKKIHHWSGLLLAVFVSFHLLNHLTVLISPETHLATMEVLRQVYRNPVVEGLLMVLVLMQITTGAKQVFQRGLKQAGWLRWQVWSGLYLAFFFVVHVSAVMVGRAVLKVDTNLYFGAAGLNTFPINLFFVPYYGLGIMAFFVHLASIHAQKSKSLKADSQAKAMLVSGGLITALILLGMTDFARGLFIPAIYQFQQP